MKKQIYDVTKYYRIIKRRNGYSILSLIKMQFVKKSSLDSEELKILDAGRGIFIKIDKKDVLQREYRDTLRKYGVKKFNDKLK